MKKPSFTTRLEERGRRKRFAVLARLLGRMERPLSILDAGGTAAYWIQSDYETLGDVKFVLLNVFHQDELPPAFSSVEGDACDLSRYSDDQFDVVFSNSVLGHVGSFDEQKRMAEEIRRVGKRYFIQTPNQGFPIDWRTLVPGFHFLPVSVQAWCFRHFRVGSYPREKDYEKSLHLARRVRNLSRSELEKLFPGSTMIPERVFGFTKSFMHHSGFDQQQP